MVESVIDRQVRFEDDPAADLTERCLACTFLRFEYVNFVGWIAIFERKVGEEETRLNYQSLALRIGNMKKNVPGYDASSDDAVLTELRERNRKKGHPIIEDV